MSFCWEIHERKNMGADAQLKRIKESNWKRVTTLRKYKFAQEWVEGRGNKECVYLVKKVNDKN